MIEGDALEALKALRATRRGGIDLICIDPPYNSGTTADYRDRFHRSQEEEDRAAGLLDREGRRRARGSSRGRRHSLWLDLIYPCLLVARDLLSPAGAVAVCIDDVELPRLRLLMDEVFGEENHCATVVWEKKYAPSNDAHRFSAVHEYVVIYGASAAFRPNLLPRTASANDRYRGDDGDGRGPYRLGDLSVRTYRASHDYPLVNPQTGREYRPPAGRCWGWSPEAMAQLMAEGRIYWGADGRRGPQLKRYLSDVRAGMAPTTLWTRDEAGHTHEARAEIKRLFGTSAVFDTPKPVRLIQRILQVAAGRDAVVLDCFAGSGTTAHAVLRQNALDGGSRTFILVQSAEPVNAQRKPEAASQYPTIADVARERIKLAAAEVRAEFPHVSAEACRWEDYRIAASEP